MEGAQLKTNRNTSTFNSQQKGKQQPTINTQELTTHTQHTPTNKQQTQIHNQHQAFNKPQATTTNKH